MTPNLEARVAAYSVASREYHSSVMRDKEASELALELMKSIDVKQLLKDLAEAIKPPSMTPDAVPPAERPMIHEVAIRDFPWATKYSRTGCETGRTHTGSKTKTFSWPDPKSSSGMQVVTVTVAAAHPTGSLYRNISLKRDTPPGDFGDFPLEVLKDIVEWAYARETTTLAQRAVAEFAAELGMTETGKSEHRVYSSQPSMQNIPKNRDAMTELGPLDATGS